jgi:hypothetical protein
MANGRDHGIGRRRRSEWMRCKHGSQSDQRGANDNDSSERQPKEKQMGTMTDLQIAEWQEKTGIKPATGERLEILTALSHAAYDAIKIIELEISGIRHGDGAWHGADVIGGMISRFAELGRRLDDYHTQALRKADPNFDAGYQPTFDSLW